MTCESDNNKLRMRLWMLMGVTCLVGTLLLLWLTGVLRPPRPLFHNKYATPFNSDRLPHWVPDAPVTDVAGHIGYFDIPMNLMFLGLPLEQGIRRFDPGLLTAEGEQRIHVPFYGAVILPADPRDLLIIVDDCDVLVLASLEEGDAAVVKAWWEEVFPRDAVRELIDDNRIPASIRTALDEFRR